MVPIRPSSITITLIGDPGGGKTSLTKHLLGKEFNGNERVTVGASFSFFEIKSATQLKLKICDIAGQASFATVRRNYLAHSDGGLLIFDLTNKQSLDNLDKWLMEFIDANPGNSPLLLIGNKVDLLDDRQITMSHVKKFLALAESNPKITNRIIGYYETSAKTGENVKISFEKIAKYVKTIH